MFCSSDLKQSAISIESASENGDIPDMKRIKLDDPRIANFNLIKKDCHTLENMRYVGRLDRNDQLVSFGWTKDDVLEKEVRVPVEMNFIQVEFFETMKIMMSIDREITLNWLDSLLLWVNKYEPKNADDLKLYFAPPKGGYLIQKRPSKRCYDKTASSTTFNTTHHSLSC